MRVRSWSQSIILVILKIFFVKMDCYLPPIVQVGHVSLVTKLEVIRTV